MNVQPAKTVDDPSPPKILIVDDDPFQVQLLETILAKENYKTIGYTDNLKVLEDVAGLNPDLILLDLIMPGIDGFELCRRLKADERTRSIPVIFVTARKDQATESAGFQLGAVDYITKPFNAIVIKARVRNHIELKRHRDALELLIQERTAERDKSQQQFQELVEKSLVGIAIIQDCTVVYQNPELMRTIDDLAVKIRNQDFSFIHPDNLAQLKLAYQNIVNTSIANVEADFQIVAKNHAGSDRLYKWVNCRASTFNYQGRETILIN
ncbi:MAG: response regulator, partial [Desulfobacteraceae bacterium]